MPLVNAEPGLGHRIAARRLQLKKTQEEVEREAKIARTTLSRLERPNCPLVPRGNTIARIAKALKIDPERLLQADAELDGFEIPLGRAKVAVIRNGADRRRGVPRKRRARSTA